MPYLEDDPAIDYLDYPDEVFSEREAGGGMPRPKTIPLAPPNLGAPPVPRPVGAGDQPTISEIIARSQPQPPAISPDQQEMNGAVSAVRDAQAKRTAALQGRPTTPEPTWWQRLAAGAAGAAAGYTNAAGRTHVDPSGAIAGIYGVPGQKRKMDAWQKQYEGAQMDAENADQNLTTLQRIRAMQTADQRAASDQEEKHARAEKESQFYAAQEKKAELAANERYDAGLLKTPDAFQFDESERDKVPQDWAVTPSKGTPGSFIATPPRFQLLTEALKPYAQGYEVGTKVPYSIFKEAQKRANDDLIKNTNKPDPAAKENENQWIADSQSSDPRVSAPAKAKLNQLRQFRVSTQASQNPAAPTPATDYQPGSREYKIAQDLAYGKLTMAQFRSLSAYSRDTNKKMDIYNKASDLNPNFNPAAFEMGYTLAKNPKVQQQLSALDNVNQGIGDLLKFSDAASRTGVPLINKFTVPGGIMLGGKKYSNFDTAVDAFSDELSGALGFGSATDMKLKLGLKMTDRALSPEVFRSNVEEVLRPFVARKKKTLLDQMGVYGQPGMNPAAADAPSSPTPQPNDGGRGGAGGGMISVQIPGHPPGQIPASAKAEFMRQHPDAVVR